MHGKTCISAHYNTISHVRCRDAGSEVQQWLHSRCRSRCRRCRVSELVFSFATTTSDSRLIQQLQQFGAILPRTIAVGQKEHNGEAVQSSH